MEKYPAVFTNDMEYPVGMDDDEARAIHYAIERRFIADEVAYHLNHPEEYPWMEQVIERVEAGEITHEELFEAVFSAYWDRGNDDSLAKIVREAMTDA